MSNQEEHRLVDAGAMINSLTTEDIAAQWVAAFNDAELSPLRVFCRDDLIVHAAPTGDNAAPGIDRVLSLLRLYRMACPQGRFAVESIETQGEITWCRWIARGTHQGPFLHVPPTNRDVTIRGTCRFFFVNGLIVEHWFDVNLYDIFQQLGALLPEPGEAADPSRQASEAAMTAWIDALHGRRLAFDQVFRDDVLVHASVFGRCSTAKGRAALDALWGTLCASVSDIQVTIDDCFRQGATSTYRGRLSGRVSQQAERSTHRLYCMFVTAGDTIREMWARIESKVV